MSLVYEDADGTVRTVQKRAVAKMAYSGQDVGTMPVPESVNSVSDVIGAQDMFKSHEALVEHAKDFANNLCKDRKLDVKQKEALMEYAENVISSMPAELKQYRHLADFNKMLQSRLNDYLINL